MSNFTGLPNDIYRIKNNRFIAFPLASLSGLINKDKNEIYRHVSFLQGEYYLEYEVCDGGQCTSDITDYGINLCEDKLELFSIFSVVRPTIKDEEKKEKKEVGELADDYVAKQRIEQFNSIKHNDFDLTKLIQLCKELNVAHKNRCYLSIAMIIRTIINHVPPIFGFGTFPQVVSNYGGKSFKQLMDKLDGACRKIADSHLHKSISRKEILPEFPQVNFKAELDFLFSEIIAKLQ